VGVSPLDHLILPLVVPLARTDSRDVHNRSLGSELEVVGANQIRTLLGLAQHME
jgi:hypothetical protein